MTRKATIKTLMPHQATNSSEDALEEILQRLVLLDRTGLLQLQEQLVELISLFPPLLTEQSCRYS